MHIEWDTAMVLTAILAPLSIALLIAWLTQLARINELKHDKDAALAKVAELQSQITRADADCDRRIADTSQQKDDEIKRQKKVIEDLHNALAERPNVSGGGSMG